jgi:hypothetical protein
VFSVLALPSAGAVATPSAAMILYITMGYPFSSTSVNM